MPFEVTPSKPGEFSSSLDIFLDVGYLARQTVSVKGSAKAAN